MRKLDPLDLVRGTTVWLMKDRAGRVGAHGVQQLLADMLGATQADVHLVGHSYGGKVVLSGPLRRRHSPAGRVGAAAPARDEPSLLLPADRRARPAWRLPAGAGPAALPQPILTTFSSHDEPLTREFHLFVRRRSDLAEAVIAGEAPSRYAALGGYGPAPVGGESTVRPDNDPGTPYTLDGGASVLGIESSRVIGGTRM